MKSIHPHLIVKAAALLVLAALPARALLTEPDKVYFGTMTVNGRAVTQTDTQYVVRVNRGSTAAEKPLAASGCGARRRNDATA